MLQSQADCVPVDNPVSAIQWGASLSSGPDLCSASSGWRGALLRRWVDTPPFVDQPKLDQHCLVLHLGGAKEVTRVGEGSTTRADVPLLSLTLIPAGAAYRWNTKGPIAYAHIFIDPGLVDRAVQEHFDRDPRHVQLVDCVAAESPLVRALFMAMLTEIEARGPLIRLKLDTLLQTLLVQLVCERSTLDAATPGVPHSLAPSRLRRVLDFIEAHLAEEIDLDDLAAVAGSSRFHFSHAFRDATGFPPYRFLVHRRIAAAKPLLLEDKLSIEHVAIRCGFKSSAQFAVMFKQVFGTTPSRFRRER